MIFIIIFIFELAVLFLLSKKVTRGIYRLLFRISKNKKITLIIYSILFLPGTFIHEISHFLAALCLLVPVGTINLTPEVVEDGISLGKVPIAKTDFIRRTLVGIAPFLFGIGIILFSLWFVISKDYYKLWWVSVILVYLLFQVGNTMFLSKSDLKGAIEFGILLIFLIIIIYLLGLQITVREESIFMSILIKVFKTGSIYLLVPVTLDLFVSLSLNKVFKT